MVQSPNQSTCVHNHYIPGSWYPRHRQTLTNSSPCSYKLYSTHHSSVPKRDGFLQTSRLRLVHQPGFFHSGFRPPAIRGATLDHPAPAVVEGLVYCRDGMDQYSVFSEGHLYDGGQSPTVVVVLHRVSTASCYITSCSCCTSRGYKSSINLEWNISRICR